MKINLRDYYPFYQQDIYVDVPEAVVIQFRLWEREERTYRQKRRRYQAVYSLDWGNGLEARASFSDMSPDEYYEKMLTRKQLHAALSTLPDKQAKRIYAHCVLGMSKTAIAASEGVSRVAISTSITRGLRRLEKLLKLSIGPVSF